MRTRGAIAAPGLRAADAGGEPTSSLVGRTGGVCQVAPPEQDQRRVGGADEAGGLGGVGAKRVAPSDPGGDAALVVIEGVVAGAAACREAVMSWMVAMVETSMEGEGCEPWPGGREFSPPAEGGYEVGTGRRGMWSSSSWTAPVPGRRCWI